jgi:hypothetical protein
MRRAALLVLLGALALPAAAQADHSFLEWTSQGPVGGNGPYNAGGSYISADGRTIVFYTEEQLTVDDTDNAPDLYLRFAGTTTLVSKGPSGGNGGYSVDARGVSRDGTKVVFSTYESLVPQDTDTQSDVYQWSNGTTTLLSTGPTGGNGSYGAFTVGMSDDGSRVAFATSEKLVPDDTDNSVDYYVRSGSTTELITTGPTGGVASIDPAYFTGFSGDATRAYFSTAESLVSGDTDTSIDIYERSGGTTTLVSTGPSGGNGPYDAGGTVIPRASDKILFSTRESLVSADTDSQFDVYQRSGGTTTLVSTGPSGGNGPYDARFGVTSSDDGNAVFFDTSEQLTSEDTDSQQDVYERSGGATTLISTGPSGGNGAYDAGVVSVSGDGSVVVFNTAEALVPEDTNGARDIYEVSGGTTRLLSGPPVQPVSPCDDDTKDCPFFVGMSLDGTRIFFYSSDPLVAGAPNGGMFEYAEGRLFLMPGATFGGTRVSEDGSRLIYYSYQRLLSGDTDNAADIYSIAVPTGYPRPKAAAPTRVSLVPAYAQCTPAAANRTHGPPLGFPSCSSPNQTSSELTIGTADANGQPTKSVSFVRYGVQVGNPSTPADEADVRIIASITDVRNKSDLSDYAGELQLDQGLRITDRDNGSPGPGTVSDADFPVTIPCVPTADTTVGSTCAIDTTVEAIVPNALKEGRRAVWEIGQVKVYDGGTDGAASTTADNTLFMDEGLFVP